MSLVAKVLYKQEKPCLQISIYSFKLAMYSHHLYVNHYNEPLNLL